MHSADFPCAETVVAVHNCAQKRRKPLYKSKSIYHPSSLVSTVLANGGVMVWVIFSWITLTITEHNVNTTTYLSIVADPVHPFMTTVNQSSDNYFQQGNAPSQSTNLRLVSWTWTGPTRYKQGVPNKVVSECISLVLIPLLYHTIQKFCFKSKFSVETAMCLCRVWSQMWQMEKV